MRDAQFARKKQFKQQNAHALLIAILKTTKF